MSLYSNLTVWKTLTAVFLFLIFGVSKPQPVLGGITCTPVYGGGQECVEVKERAVSIEKLVSFNKSGDFKDKVEDAKAEETVYFKITVKNTGDTALENLKIEDDLPRYLTPKGDTEWGIDKLEPNQEWATVFAVEVESEENLPEDNTCVVNEARVKDEGKILDEDTAVVCIEAPTKVLGAKALPVTGGSEGSPDLSFGVIAFGMALLGLGLRKIA